MSYLDKREQEKLFKKFGIIPIVDKVSLEFSALIKPHEPEKTQKDLGFHFNLQTKLTSKKEGTHPTLPIDNIHIQLEKYKEKKELEKETKTLMKYVKNIFPATVDIDILRLTENEKHTPKKSEFEKKMEHIQIQMEAVQRAEEMFKFIEKPKPEPPKIVHKNTRIWKGFDKAFNPLWSNELIGNGGIRGNPIIDLRPKPEIRPEPYIPFGEMKSKTKILSPYGQPRTTLDNYGLNRTEVTSVGKKIAGKYGITPFDADSVKNKLKKMEDEAQKAHQQQKQQETEADRRRWMDLLYSYHGGPGIGLGIRRGPYGIRGRGVIGGAIRKGPYG